MHARRTCTDLSGYEWTCACFYTYTKKPPEVQLSSPEFSSPESTMDALIQSHANIELITFVLSFRLSNIINSIFACDWIGVSIVLPGTKGFRTILLSFIFIYRGIFILF